MLGEHLVNDLHVILQSGGLYNRINQICVKVGHPKLNHLYRSLKGDQVLNMPIFLSGISQPIDLTIYYQK